MLLLNKKTRTCTSELLDTFSSSRTSGPLFLAHVPPQMLNMWRTVVGGVIIHPEPVLDQLFTHLLIFQYVSVCSAS